LRRRLLAPSASALRNARRREDSDPLRFPSTEARKIAYEPFDLSLEESTPSSPAASWLAYYGLLPRVEARGARGVTPSLHYRGHSKQKAPRNARQSDAWGCFRGCPQITRDVALLADRAYRQKPTIFRWLLFGRKTDSRPHHRDAARRIGTTPIDHADDWLAARYDTTPLPASNSSKEFANRESAILAITDGNQTTSTSRNHH
jgi:hypothetical protein